MFSKILILVLLGCSLALAQVESANEDTDIVVVRSRVLEKFSSWYQKAKTTIKKAYNKTVQEFEKVYERLVEVGNNLSEKSSEKLEELKVKYHKLKVAFKKKLNEIESKILPKVMTKFQQLIEYLSKIVANKTVKEIKAAGEEIVQKGKQAVDQIGGEIQAVVEEKFDTVKETLGQWKDEVHDFLGSGKVNENKENNGIVDAVKSNDKNHEVREEIIENEEKKDKVDDVKEAIGDVGEKIKGVGETIIESEKEMQEKVGDVKGIFGGLGGNMQGIGSKNGGSVGGLFGKK